MALEDLSDLRNKIDQIDEKIISLLKERMEIVKQVGKRKAKGSGNNLNFIRPGREASMIRHLIENNTSDFSPEALATIWRVIISSALNLEQKMEILTYVANSKNECYWLAREYYGRFTTINQSASCEEIIKQVEVNKHIIGALPVDNDWWIRPEEEKNNIYIFAKIPFIQSDEKEVLLIANVIPEDTEDDISLFAIKTNDFAKTRDEFGKAGIVINLLLEKEGNYLVETEDFIPADDQRINKINTSLAANCKVRLLGSYAKPIKIRK